MTLRRWLALALCLASAAVRADDVDDALGRGAAAAARGDLAGALADFREAAGLASVLPGDAREAEALQGLGRAALALGNAPAAALVLERAIALEQGRGAGERLPALLGLLAQARLATGDLDRAEAALAAALQMARDDARLGAALRNDLGNLREAQGRAEDARAAWSESARLAEHSGDGLARARARINLARSLAGDGRIDGAKAELGLAHGELDGLAASPSAAQAWLSLAAVAERLGDTILEADALGRSASAAEASGDARAASWALGRLGAVYERRGSRAEGLALTRRALREAQRAAAPEASYRWQWQSARLLAAQADTAAALDAWRGAARALEALRADGCSARGSAAPDFAREIAPVYDGLTALLLETARATEDAARRQALLREARDTVESLKVSELRDWFADPCVAPRTVTAPDAIPGTVVLYPILLEDRTELIASLPGGLEALRVSVPTSELVSEARALRRLLEKRTTREYLRPAARLYDWLIRPVRARLAQGDASTFVLVPAGALRTIPLAALYDREAKQFLVEQRALAVTPGLTLTDPRAIDRSRVQMLVAGLTKAVQGYPALPNVPQEVDAARETFGASALIDERFVAGALEAGLREQRPGIVHIASHGEFGSGPADTYLLTYDDRLTLDGLAALVGIGERTAEPLELLALSACQTAAGDDRAALGLAGVAVRAGARSALATLWFVNDQASAELVSEFYRQLQAPGVSRAEALRRAQLHLLAEPSYRHPGYWAAFLLISSWL
jgi:CHAT domain-containing protein